MKNNKITPITLEIDKNLWKKFKDAIPRSISLNEALVILIQETSLDNYLIARMIKRKNDSIIEMKGGKIK